MNGIILKPFDKIIKYKLALEEIKKYDTRNDFPDFNDSITFDGYEKINKKKESK